jgi:hypothetical protein
VIGFFRFLGFLFMSAPVAVQVWVLITMAVALYGAYCIADGVTRLALRLAHRRGGTS